MTAATRKRYSGCTWCKTLYATPKAWQFCGPACRHAWRKRGNDKRSTGALVRERLEIGLQLEIESRAWIREPLLKRAAEITELLR